MASSSSGGLGASGTISHITPHRDGKLSIEHHISIDIMDALAIMSGVEKSLTIEDVLASIRHLYNARIKGKQPNLDLSVMKRLVDLLLLLMKKTEGKLRKRMSKDSDLAFALFTDFLETVQEFQAAVESKSTSSLRYQLKLDRRLDDKDRKAEAIRVLAALRNLSKFADWQSLVSSEFHADVEKALGSTDDMIPKSPTDLPQEGIYYDVEVAAVQTYFQTDFENGLAASSISDRIARYGFNKLPEPPKPSYLKMIWEQATDFMVLILLAAAAISAGFQDYKAAIVLVIVVAFNVIIGFVQEYKAEKALASLMSLSVPQAVVIRDGKQTIVPSQELVPGDVVVLDEGAAVPADLRLFEVAQLNVNESILTGESLPVEKKTAPIRAKIRNVPIGDRVNMAFMSTAVTKGRGKGVVVASGNETEVGKISGALAQAAASKKKTPLQQKLGTLGKWLVLISIVLCGLVVGIGVARGNDAEEMVKVGISLAVSVIPEGLVAVVTITMALGVKRMAARSAIVRKLPSVETLGSVTTICSDKTGTLTEGKMKAEITWVDGENFTFTGSGNKPDDGYAAGQDGKELGKRAASVPARLRFGMMVCSLCNNATITKNDVPDSSGEEWAAIGDPTEIALVVAAMKAGVAREHWLATYGLRPLCEFAFDSDRKRMSVIYSVERGLEVEGGCPPYMVMAKGASEAILKHCKSVVTYNSSGEMVFQALDDVASGRIDEQGGLMASQGLRVIGLAVRPLTQEQAISIKESNNSNLCETDLAFVGLIGLIDPPRREVKDSIRVCHEAGIRVCMITGDHAATATSIAKSLGILDEKLPTDGLVLKGEELDLYNEEHLAEINPFPLVFARVSPDNKFKIVRALQSRGEVVAMTGDGVNDAPAIKQANVGVAMGIAGTEITKQAAAIVLANDNFATIVVAVEEGRRIFDNISKFILYLLSCNTAEIIIMLLSVIIGTAYVPFSPIMILWANLVVDIPPSLSLGLEPAEADVMVRAPRNPKKGVFSKMTAAILLVQGFSMSLISLAVFLIAYYAEDYSRDNNAGYERKRVRTMTFIVLCMIQLNHAFFCRSVRTSVFKTGIIGNRLLVYAWGVSVILLIMGVYIPGLNDLLELVPMGGLDWAKVVIASIIHLLIVEFEKFILRRVVASKPKRMKRIESIEMGNVSAV